LFTIATCFVPAAADWAGADWAAPLEMGALADWLVPGVLVPQAAIRRTAERISAPILRGGAIRLLRCIR
jgi:hypothetical protein